MRFGLFFIPLASLLFHNLCTEIGSECNQKSPSLLKGFFAFLDK